MCCFFLALVLLGPRIAGVLWWIIQTPRWQDAFSGFLWPALGLIFLPWTTLLYVAFAAGGVVGFEWVWVFLGVLIDAGSYGGGFGRYRIPSYEGC